MTLQEEKQALRKVLRVRELRMMEEYKIRTGGAIVAAILSMDAYQAAECVSCFVGTGAEVDTAPLLEDALRVGKRLCVPLCLGHGVMEMRRIRSLDELSPGTMGLLEPSPESERVQPEEIDFIVVPCLACDRQGNRMGRGGGYYDRYLPCVHGVRVSPCREFMLQDRLPTGPHDAPIEYVRSERGFYRQGVLYIL